MFAIFASCLELSLVMSYRSNLFFIFNFIKINLIIIQTYLLFCRLFRKRPITLGWLRGWRIAIFWKSSASGCCLAFAWFFGNFSLALLIKMLLLIKKKAGAGRARLQPPYFLQSLWRTTKHVFLNWTDNQ